MLPMRRQKPLGKKFAEIEDLEFEIRFFEGIARRDANYIEALQILGDAYTKTGQWRKGLQVDERLARLCPDNPLVFYNLACSYALQNRLDEAFGALDKSIKLGYNDEQWLDKDPDLENLRRDRRFERIRTDLSKRNPGSEDRS
jgi:tetratricopeptide (TPR) repeat protein